MAKKQKLEEKKTRLKTRNQLKFVFLAKSINGELPN